MGQQSQHNTPPFKAAKRRGARRKAIFKSAMMRDEEKGGVPSKPCVTCMRNAARKKNPARPAYKKQHAKHCEHNNEEKKRRREAAAEEGTETGESTDMRSSTRCRPRDQLESLRATRFRNIAPSPGLGTRTPIELT